MANKHLYLRNETGRNDGFNKSRNVQSTSNDDQELEPSRTPSQTQQDRLRRAHAIFYTERKQRNDQRQRNLNVPAIIDLVFIRFYKIFNDSLKKEFYKKYGLLVSSYEDFNKSVLFEIADTELFKTFISHVELFYDSPLTETYQGKEYNLIALINDFKFFSSKRRIKSYSTEVSSLSLIPPQNRAANDIYTSLLTYLRDRDKTVYQTEITTEIIEVQNLRKEDIEEIANNFDIVKTVTSTRTERRRPGVYGEERRDYGFNITVAENLPVVGVIDTGFFPIAPLRPCISPVLIDLTNTAALIDDSGHGTAVGSLVALGQEFLIEIKENYEAKAKLAIIKAIQNDNDNLNIIQLVEAIKAANISHGVRLFNLSLNDPMPKGYNKPFSDYAYLLDKLAFERDLLIFISVGNISEQRLRELIEETHNSHEYPTVFYSLDNGSEIHSCESTNISEPSESLNNVSIGALAGNLEGTLNSDITPAEEFPAYYTRKFHYDYEQSVNGSEFLRSQKNKHLNKPDLVFEGGDLFRHEAGMEVLRSPIEPNGQRFFSRSCGTSLAAPLITSLAAQILKEYPVFRTQTVKALLINSADAPVGTYTNPPIPFRGFPINLFRKLTGFGRPYSNVLTATDDNSITFVIESEIKPEELQTIIISLPEYINKSGNKLNFKGTLCYSFLPIRENHLSYLPLQITFGIFKPIDASEMGKKDDRRNNKKGTQTGDYIIKSGMSWSDDFFGVDNRLFSNVQQIDHNVSGEQIAELGNKVSLAIRCVAKNDIPESHKTHLEQSLHKFSLVLTITELPTSRASNRLYSDIAAINNVEAIADIEVEGHATAEIE
ncbi:S8 family peptidase [Chitinophaga japonensis]|uniref:Subtilase family protein n=1 Tax=Chitinophaga japonensis TaxID=104662 RepID=A0A562TCZ7_CHIJA|nr:S8 family peptidase [Chitinophaga japonensis]TWI91148.1 subtilase family protein [Chitinophaga japonensis]